MYASLKLMALKSGPLVLFLYLGIIFLPSLHLNNKVQENALTATTGSSRYTPHEAIRLFSELSKSYNEEPTKIIQFINNYFSARNLKTFTQSFIVGHRNGVKEKGR